MRIPTKILVSVLFLGGCGGPPGQHASDGAPPLTGDTDLAMPSGDLATCADTTGIAGRVFAPNGLDPVPKATVFVPAGAIKDFPAQVSCDLCNDIGAAIASTQTGVDGFFQLTGIPPGKGIPVVIQLGRFRRVVTVDVEPCNIVILPTDAAVKGTRLPKKNAEFSPHDSVPKIAVATGDYDQIECVLKRMGINQIDLFNDRGGIETPPTLGALSTLLGDRNKLLGYNILVVNCTNNEFESLVANPTIRQNLAAFVGMGGRLYATDWAYDSIEQIPEFAPFMCFVPQNGAALMCSQPPQQATSADTNTSYDVLASIKDPDLAAWLKQFPNVIQNNQVQVDFSFVIINGVATNQMQYPSTTWVEGKTPMGVKPMTVTFDYNSCGRVHYSTYNTEPNGVVPDNMRYPNCKPTFSPQERILEYLVFQIAACVGPPLQ